MALSITALGGLAAAAIPGSRTDPGQGSYWMPWLITKMFSSRSLSNGFIKWASRPVWQTSTRKHTDGQGTGTDDLWPCWQYKCCHCWQCTQRLASNDQHIIVSCSAVCTLGVIFGTVRRITLISSYTGRWVTSPSATLEGAALHFCAAVSNKSAKSPQCEWALIKVDWHHKPISQF